MVRRAVAVLLALAGLYIFIGPFTDSPSACLRGFPASGPLERIEACMSMPSVATSFIVGGAFALLLVSAGLFVAFTSRDTFHRRQE